MATVKLLSLRTQGLAHLPDRTWTFGNERRPADALVVTGRGKTSFLETIAAAKELIAPYRTIPVLPLSQPDAEIETAWLLSEEEARGPARRVVEARTRLGERATPPFYDPRLCDALSAFEPGRGKVEYFHQDRALPRTFGLSSPRRPCDASDKLDRLRPAGDKYRWIRAWLEDEEDAEARALAEGLAASGAVLAAPGALRPRLREAMRLFTRRIAYGRVDSVEGVRRVRFETDLGATVDLDDLSASERQFVIFCATFLRFGLSRSIVLVDEPEAHLPRAARTNLLANLQALGMDNQLFAASDADEVVRAVRPEQVVDLG